MRWHLAAGCPVPVARSLALHPTCLVRGQTGGGFGADADDLLDQDHPVGAVRHSHLARVCRPNIPADAAKESDRSASSAVDARDCRGGGPGRHAPPAPRPPKGERRAEHMPGAGWPVTSLRTWPTS